MSKFNLYIYTIKNNKKQKSIKFKIQIQNVKI